MASQVALGDFLKPAEIRLIINHWNAYGRNNGSFVDWVVTEIIQPNMPRINAALGQQNDARYLAYAIQFAMMQEVS